MAAKGKKGGRIIILVALILILAVGAVYVWLQMQPSQVAEPLPTPAPAQKMVDIVITTQFIPRGAEITEGTVMTVQYPEENLVQGTFITDINSVYGQRAKYDLDPGVPLTSSILLEPMAGSVPSFDIPKDFVAMPIPISRLTSVAYALQPGDHVMVIGCMLLVDVDPDFQTVLPNQVGQVVAPGFGGEGGPTTSSIGIIPGGEGSTQGRAELDPTLNEAVYVQPSELQRPRMVCQSVIQDAVVLKVGTFETPEQIAAAQAAAAAAQQDQANQEAAAPTPVPSPDMVTLVVSPQDAVTLNYILMSSIKLNLALRNPTDTNPIVTDAVTQQYLMDQKNIPLPAKLPYSLQPRVDELNFPPLANDAQPTPAPEQ